MNKEQVFELIHQNGRGQNLRCFFISGDAKVNQDHISLINHYKYKKGVVSIYMNRYSFEEHHKRLATFLECRLLIKEDRHKQPNTVWLFCKFLKVEKQDIYARVFSVQYLDDEKKEVTLKVPVGG